VYIASASTFAKWIYHAQLLGALFSCLGCWCKCVCVCESVRKLWEPTISKLEVENALFLGDVCSHPLSSWLLVGPRT